MSDLGNLVYRGNSEDAGLSDLGNWVYQENSSFDIGFIREI